ncbi:MAG: DNA polymerase III subunit chi [Gammaproteobacteria bacterium]|nr:DNA polymerase III subunit chi [Gammaproteobacteria bacterium]
MPRPRVDFYVLPSAESGTRLRFACRLIETAWLERQRVRVRLDGEDEVAAFDDLLWTFADRSFVPHERGSGAVAPDAHTTVVLVDARAPDPATGDLLVNLGTAVPAGWERYARIAEVVDADAARRQSGRARFRFYREQGVEPGTHETGSEP